MTDFAAVREALTDSMRIAEMNGRLAILTHCLYPSNASVPVSVYGTGKRAQVTDDGGALDQLSAHGCFVEDSTHLLRRFCRNNGLKVEDGKIYSPIVPFEGIAPCVRLVASASSAAARWGLDNIKAHHRRDLHKEIRNMLERQYGSERVQRDGHMAGASNRKYRFDNIVELDMERRLIVDAVSPDPISLNSRVVAHLDVQRIEDSNIIQRIIYDDCERWQSSDLNLLQMASKIIPFSSAKFNLMRIQ